MQPRQLDTDIQRHMLDINPLQLAFYKVFSGWREVTDEDMLELYGKTKVFKRVRFDIDPNGRACNESGANMLFTEVIPLISPASTTSHMKPIDIYNLWSGHLDTISVILLDSYFIPKYICGTKDCRFSSPNEKIIAAHMASNSHVQYTSIINPYDLDITKHANIITFLCTLSIITNKSKEGFTLRELAESFMTQQVIRNGYQSPQPMQQPSLLQRITGRG
jgi:hypothetical protein